MNVRRGLIRLWVFASAIWIAGVVLAAVYDPKLQQSEPENPFAKYVEPQPPTPAAPKTFSFEDALPSNDQAAPATQQEANPWGDLSVPAGQEPDQGTDIRRTLSKHAMVAFGPPIILLMLGAGVGWVAAGFKSDTSPSVPNPEPPPDPGATARNRRRWRILLPLIALCAVPYLGNDQLAATFVVVALIPPCLR